MPKYKIHIVYPDKHTELKEVIGYPVKIKELDGIDLFIHRTLNAKEYWSISEVKTGYSLVSFCHGTKGNAITALRASLANSKVPNVKVFIEDKIKEFGNE